AMPSPSDSSRSLTGRSSRSLTHLRLQRTWLQVLLVLGLVQAILGVLIVTFSLVAATITPSAKIRHSCPSWAGFSVTTGWEGCEGTSVTTGHGLAGEGSSALSASFWCEGSTRGPRGDPAARILAWLCCPARAARSPQALNQQFLPSCGARVAPTAPWSCSLAGSMLAGIERTLPVGRGCSGPHCLLPMLTPGLVHLQLALSGLLVPQRSSSVTLECTSPPDTFLQSMMDFEEFVPPVPPPPYYPPEYTCSSETDAQSITYNGSMDSPVPLYPTDFPPSYETVMGLRGDSQATLFDSQLTEGSHACTCDRVPSIVLSGEGECPLPARGVAAGQVQLFSGAHVLLAVSMDSGSLIMSEIMDIPGDSSPSEDSCLLELQGSMRSVDYVLFRSIQRSRADYCLSVDCVQCSHHARSPTLGLQGPFEERPQPRVRGERSYSCSTAEPSHDGILVGGAVTHSCNRLAGPARCAGPCFPEVRLKDKGSSLQGRGAGRPTDSGASRPGHPRRNSETSCPSSPAPGLALRPLLRSHSDPGVPTAGHAADFREVLYTKALEDTVSDSSADTGLCSEACLLRRSHCDSPPLLRAGSCGRVMHASAILVTSVLLPRVPPGERRVEHRGVSAGGCHDRAAIPAAAACPRGLQVPWSAWPGAERPHDGIHLQSCGDLSSTSSLRRLLSTRRLERSRPRSLSGACKESAL
ncbi:F189B protein, partial [Spelaeornis formosus]|nr:F189B protein [Elachura formosa]